MNMERTEELRVVNHPVAKVDSEALVTGKAVYTNDLAPADCLIVKIVRSPHAHALIKEIDTSRAEAVPGIECVLTYKDCPDKRFTLAGQTYPEPSPYDRLILDQRMRFVGDAAAIVAGTSEEAVKKAMKLVKIKYEVLEPVLDFRKAKDNPILVHPEENWRSLCNVGADNKRNLCAHDVCGEGDVDAVLDSCDYVIDRVYHTKANQQTMMETFRTYTYMDAYGRLNVVSSTQVPFHVRRILGNALDIPKHKVRVIKPRIGGGFGAKQTSVSEVYPALVTWKTGKPAKIIYTREESMIASSPRHEMEMHVRVGADKEGRIRAIDLHTLSNTGAFGEHGPTTVGLSGHKSIPLYGSPEAFRFTYDVKNMVREGMVMPAYYGETTKSCALDRCMARAKEMIGWDEKYPCRDMGNGKVRGVGVAMAMQGSGISHVDTGSVAIKVNDDGYYSLMIGATDMGTGCDTILTQMAAECLDCDMSDILVHGVDTDVSPYDCGSYASSTTYVTGMAVVRTCETLRKKLCERGAEYLGCSVEDVEFDGQKVTNLKTGESITRRDIGNKVMSFNNEPLSASEAFSSPTSPPPFMVGMAEVEIDKETGVPELIDYVAVVDCGTVVNPSLARVQVEGGIAQGIGMALYEDIVYNEKGKNYSNSFMQYKIPSRLDVGTIRVEFESSYEPTGPFGAKSIGEIVINTPSPAISNAIQNAVGVIIRELPMTAEKIYWGMQKDK